MKIISIALAGLCLIMICSCSGLNISGGGQLKDIDLNASVDPVNKDANVNAGTTVKKGNTQTNINTSTDGKSANTNADVQYTPEDK